MYDFPKIGTGVIAMMVAAMVIFVVAPIVLWIVWCVKKKEKFTTILVGAAAFFVFDPFDAILLLPSPLS